MTSRFAKLKEAQEARGVEPEAAILASEPEPPTPVHESEPTSNKERGRPTGRPAGRRSDPNYEQLTTFILRELHERLKLRGFQERRPIADYFEEALLEWEERHKEIKPKR